MLKELAIQSGLMRDLKAIFPHNWAEILSLAMFFVIYPDQNLANYDVTAAHCDFPSPPLSSQRISELLASIPFKQCEQYMKLRCSVRLLTVTNSGVDRHQFRPSSVRNWSTF